MIGFLKHEYKKYKITKEIAKIEKKEEEILHQMKTDDSKLPADITRQWALLQNKKHHLSAELRK